jgi:signal transduction histidine kinase
MPGLDGFGVLARLRQDPMTALVPFVFLTVIGDAGTLRSGMDLGADDYLVKPVGLDQLLRTVATRLERHARAREHAQRLVEGLRASIAKVLPERFLTPLTTVIGLASLLADKETPLGELSIRDVGHGILTAGRDLQEMIEKFLLCSELEAVATGTKASAHCDQLTPAAAVVRDAAEVAARSVARQASLQLDLDDSLVLGLPQRYLHAIARELVENALRFSSQETPVSVAVRVDSGDSGLLIVSDRGKGMAPAEIARLGTIAQLDRERKEQPGTGFGFAIVKRVAALCGGEVTVESGVGGGSTIQVRLPTRIRRQG